MAKPEVRGFLAAARRTAAKGTYQGRFTCHDVQWTGEGPESLVTFTVTAEEVADAAESRLLWTDQDVQRGIKPGFDTSPPRELSVGDGYPDLNQYIFDAGKADDITEKLLRGDRLFLSPLVWNLRPGSFSAYYDARSVEVYLYEGQVYLPDSHHRQQAIVKAVRAFRDAPSSYPGFSVGRQFKVELYFLSKDDEGNYFFDKNQRPKPAAKSKAFDLTTEDDLSVLAKRVIDLSDALRDNVNRVTDRLTARNPQVITLSTLREMVRTLAPADALDEPEIEGLARVSATFYDLLAEVRPELGHMTQAERRATRDSLIVTQAVMMHGYAFLTTDFNDDIGAGGVRVARNTWQKKLKRLSSATIYTYKTWQGDLFEKRNPLWQDVGVVKPGRDGRRLTVLNTGAARSECGRILRQLLALSKGSKDLQYLA